MAEKTMQITMRANTWGPRGADGKLMLLKDNEVYTVPEKLALMLIGAGRAVKGSAKIDLNPPKKTEKVEK